LDKALPWIVEAALKNRQKHFVIDGEAVILGLTLFRFQRPAFRQAQRWIPALYL
jgi:ATP-dependent DNA ligase